MGFEKGEICMKNHTVLMLALVAIISGAVTGQVMAQTMNNGRMIEMEQEIN
jgi:adenylyl- and sulfurtransferase ThiI